MDEETHHLATCVKQIGKLATVAKRRTHRAASQGHLDLSSAEEDEGFELLHLLLLETNVSSFAILTM